MPIKDFIIIIIVLASIFLTIDAIYTVNKLYQKDKITLIARNQYIRIIFMAPLLGALFIYMRIKNDPS